MSHADKNIEVFHDTIRLCETHERLKAAVFKSTSLQKFIRETDIFPRPKLCVNKSPANVIISEKRTFEAAKGYAGTKTAVLNFANAWSVGGGVEHGANAQEECLCRSSGLFLSLKALEKEFYQSHRELFNALANDDLIYTPNVLVFKTDAWIPKLMPEAEWYAVDVITCAAPCLDPSVFKGRLPSEKLFAIHVKRLTRILDVAVMNGAETIVLGAFGCGAFANDPKVVSAAFKQVIERYAHAFKNIELAIYGSDYASENYETFCEVLSS